MALKLLKIFYRANGAAYEEIVYKNRHKQKLLGERESVSWKGVWNKDKGRDFELSKNMFLHNDMLNFCIDKTQHHWSIPWNNCVLWLENLHCEVLG